MRTLLLSILLPCSVAAQTRGPETTWYLMRLGGSPVGWMRETTGDSAGFIRTASAMYMAINRLGSQVVLRTDAVFVETRGGSLRALDVGTQMSEQEVRTAVQLRGDSARIAMDAGGRRFDRAIALADSVLGPDAIRRLTLARLQRAGDSVSYVAWDAQLNAPAKLTRTATARDSLLTVVEQSSASPVVTTIWMDAAGRALLTEFDLPFGRAQVTRADSATAMAASRGGTLGDDAYARTLVRTGIRLPRAREIERMRVRLVSPAMRPAVPSLEMAGQRVLASDDTSAVLETTRRRPMASAPFPVAMTLALKEFLEPNAYIQSDDPRLVALARRVAGRERDVLAASLALQRWVADSMRFDLGIAFAPSVEVFDRRRGTCVAYATLLATLTRAIGIPSRIVMGYAYVNGIFGGHAWTEVLVRDRWIPVDGALPADGPSDAARFAFAWSSLAGGPGELMSGPGIQLYNGVRATVERFEIGAIGRDVPANAAPWAVEANRYRNPWLGIDVVKPEGAEFVMLDETWPSSTVVGIRRGADTVRVQLRLRRPGHAPPAGAVSNGSDYYEIEAVSPGSRAVARLVRVLSRPSLQLLVR
jgi:hypothetical protein